MILRHDIDQSIAKALDFANAEHDAGVASTYFVWLTSDFYNAISPSSVRMLREITQMGHRIGLHFDETAYPEIGGNERAFEVKVRREKEMLESAMGVQLHALSMHRPSPMSLDLGDFVAGLPNSYGPTFFKRFKYVSDSRRRWREPVLDIIRRGLYQRLQVLTHAFWYDATEKSARDTIESFAESAANERMDAMRQNISDLDELIGVEAA